MMLTHQCSARAYLFVLVAILLAAFLWTANRLHGSPAAAFSHLTDALTDNPSASQQNPQPPPSAGTPNIVLDSSEKSTSGFCGHDWEFLRRKELRLSDNIVYTRRCIKPVHGNVDRDAIANVTSPLLTGSTNLNLKADCPQSSPPPCEPLSLEVPPAYPAHHDQYHHLLFGVASSYERLQESLPVFAHWLSGTGAQLVVVVSDADNQHHKHDLPALEALYRQYNIAATMMAPKLKQSLPRVGMTADTKLSSPAAVEQLHFLLIRDMLEMATPQTQWLGVLDDDTFFPALHPLSLTLRQHDHMRPRWLGVLADNWVSIKSWGFMAYGGAGTFLSVPLAKQLDPLLERCILETAIPSGDGMLKDCIHTHSTTKLTLVDGLYQHDIRGDASGFFESGRRVLSLHHWKSWYRAPVDKMAAITAVCGDCFLQRWRFGGDTLLANGYSISVYRDGLDALDLDRIEGTFDEVDDRYDFVYAPFRPRLAPDEKKSYRLVAVDDGAAEKGGQQQFRQVYVHRASREDRPRVEAVDEVVELVWEV
ncbi:glycosyltransferase [Chaetomidium leptoderma]|uniref:Glycosyltransferase n=1 Tax=Chaetomidium leptoderma TaxID=669021 RepID=A0AAN6VGT6_9PEZI|nr:glycosyltransferase [Chaetomidium leptoderma]